MTISRRPWIRRTTIFRSSRLALLVALGAVTTPLMAQDTTFVRQLPSVHVVGEGETLWGLAAWYLGDPFLWPEIYRLNTLVVEDPHWIFPGEELRLAVPEEPIAEQPIPEEPSPELPLDTLDVSPEAEVRDVPEGGPVAEAESLPPPPPMVTTPTVFAPRTSEEVVQRVVVTEARRFYRPVRAGDFYGAGFLTEGEDLPWGEVLGAVGATRLRRIRSAASANLFEEIEVRAPQYGTYHVGDSLLIAELRREIRGWGRVVRPTGIARVTSTAGRQARARIVGQFAIVADGQVALPVEPLRDPGQAIPLPVESGMTGTVIAPRDVHPVSKQQDIVFIDLGRADGVVPGDVFEVVQWRGGEDFPDAPPERVAILSVVHVREHSASGMLTQISLPGTKAGSTVRLIRKMPS